MQGGMGQQLASGTLMALLNLSAREGDLALMRGVRDTLLVMHRDGWAGCALRDHDREVMMVAHVRASPPFEAWTAIAEVYGA